MARQRTNQAANFLDLGFGSPLDLVFNTQVEFLKDADTAERNTQSEVTDLKREKVNYTASAAGSQAAASSARSAGRIQSVNTVLGGLAGGLAPGGFLSDIF